MKIIDQYWQWLQKPVNPLELIETAGRTCYKSEKKISPGSSVKFAEMLKKSGHGSVIEHASASVKFVTNRAITHELVRHRLASYCLPADVIIYSDRSNRSVKNKTIGDLAKMNKTPHGRSRIKLLRIRTMSNEGILTTGRVTSFIESGKQKVYVLKTKLGYSLPCTSRHRILTDQGYKSLSEINKGDSVFVNGKSISTNVKHVISDIVTDIVYRGVELTYDLTVEPYHNFVANGVIVHNSQESTRYIRYSGDMEFIKPVWWDDWSAEEQNAWKNAMRVCEKEYAVLLNAGSRAEQAREVLPNSLKTEIVMTANLREWMHVFNLRCSKASHPQIRALMRDCRDGFRKAIPVLFD
jgi:thymidylate synthase ThyX